MTYDLAGLVVDGNPSGVTSRVLTLTRRRPWRRPTPARLAPPALTIYSLLGSAELSGLNPEANLHDVLTRIADHAVNRSEELLL